MDIAFNTVSHAGKTRKTNEDAFFTQQQDDGSILLAVADGMGGMPGGKQASAMALKAFDGLSGAKRFTPELLSRAVTIGHESIVNYSRMNPDLDGMGTTLTAALLQNGAIFWAHVGDSRLYRLHGNKLEQLTRDHRFLTSMIEDGDITMEEARCHPLKSILEQCLGCQSINPEFGNQNLALGDLLLLCTDGLHDEISFELIEQIMNMGINAAEKAEKLLHAALEAGGRDNITVIVAKVI